MYVSKHAVSHHKTALITQQLMPYYPVTDATLSAKVSHFTA